MAHDINDEVSDAIDGFDETLVVSGGKEIGISVGCCDAEAGLKDIDIASPISTIPKMAEEILALWAIFGMTISFIVMPPPKRPARRAIQPAIAKIVGRVMLTSFDIVFGQSAQNVLAGHTGAKI